MGSHELNKFFENNFVFVRLKNNRSKRKIYRCQHCDKELEHRENRLTNHIATVAKCRDALTAARSAAHILMSEKKSGTKRSADDEVSDNGDDEDDELTPTTSDGVVRDLAEAEGEYASALAALTGAEK